jgi:hypothetical protein
MDLQRPVIAVARCRHCQTAKAVRPRGLCFRCYYSPGVRDQYPSTSKFGRRGVGNFFRNAPSPVEPTTAAPGSLEKLAVLEMRARLRQSLWHPLDARYPGDERPIRAAQVGRVA